MSSQYGSVYVNENYSKLLEPNLYFDSIFQPNITFDPSYQGDANAGVVKIYKTTRDAAIKPGAPGRDFSHSESLNSLIDIPINNNFQNSKKIYKVKANAVPYEMAEEALATAIKDTKEGWEITAISLLADTGTESTDFDTITISNIKTKVMTLKKTMRKNKAEPGVILASVDVYATAVEAAGEKFTPVFNDRVTVEGKIGRWLGFTWIEANMLSEENQVATYIDASGTEVEVDLSDVDLIMYDYRAFSIVTNLEAADMVNGQPDFVGSYAQVEYNAGFKVKNATKVLVKKNLLLDALVVTSVEGTSSGDTLLSVTPSILTGHGYRYKTHATVAPVAIYNEDLTSWTAWDGVADLTITDGHKVTVAECTLVTFLAKKVGDTTADTKA